MQNRHFYVNFYNDNGFLSIFKRQDTRRVAQTAMETATSLMIEATTATIETTTMVTVEEEMEDARTETTMVVEVVETATTETSTTVGIKATEMETDS